MEITKLVLMNTHHAKYGGYSSKKFEIRLRHMTNPHVWNPILSGELTDSTGKVETIILPSFSQLTLKIFSAM